MQEDYICWVWRSLKKTQEFTCYQGNYKSQVKKEGVTTDVQKHQKRQTSKQKEQKSREEDKEKSTQICWNFGHI